MLSALGSPYCIKTVPSSVRRGHCRLARASGYTNRGTIDPPRGSCDLPSAFRDRPISHLETNHDETPLVRPDSLPGRMPGVAVLSAVSAAADADVQIERVVGPEFPGKYKHPASIEELANGDLYIAYYGGDGEYAEQTAVYGMRRKKGESRWSTPKSSPTRPSTLTATQWSGRRRMGWCGCSMCALRRYVEHIADQGQAVA